MERFGLVGLPNAGKSRCNASPEAEARKPYAFATKDPNIGVAVPDDRVERLAR
jgi:ribosome-binding ATPase YchF (GTP1/OBG family)